MPLLSIAENIFLGNEHARYGVIDWNANETRTRELLQEGRPQRRSQDAHHQYRRRQAAAGRDRQGADQGSQAADPRRADGQPHRKGQRRAARPAARVQAAGHHLDPDLAQAQRGQQGRRPHHHAARRRRPSRRSTRQEISEDRIITSMVGRELDDRYPPRDAQDRRDRVRGEELGRLSPAPCRPAGDQGHQPQRPQGRGGRHRRPDGRRAHRVRHERVRPLLRPQHHRRGLPGRQARSTSRRSARRSTPASPMSPRTARPTASS